MCPISRLNINKQLPNIVHFVLNFGQLNIFGEKKVVQTKRPQVIPNISFRVWEKVRTTKIRTSKFKKNIKNVSKHQNIESVFLVHHYYYNQNIESVFLVHHYYDNQNIEKDIEIDFRCSDFTCGVKKDQNVQKIEISTTYGVLPMVTKPCGALGGQVRVNQVRLGQVRFHYVKLGQIRLG